MRLAAALSVALVACMPAAVGSSNDARRAWHASIGSAVPRHGIHHRSLVVVPLVLRTPTASDASVVVVPVAPEAFSWSPAAGAKAEEAATLSPAASAGSLAGPKLLPSGLVLRQGRHERLLQRPTLLAGAAAAALRTVPLAPKDGAAPAESVVRRFDGIAPPEYGHTLFLLPDRDALRDLLSVESLLAGRDPAAEAPRLVAIHRVPVIAKRVEAAVKAIAPIGKAYGGETVGHLAFLGGRPIQFVLARSPVTYSTYMKHAARGLALSVVLWEELYGRTGAPVRAPAWTPTLEAAVEILENLAHVTVKREKRGDEQGTAGELWRVRSTKNRHGRKTSDIGWLLLDAKQHTVWIEAWPEGTLGPLPKPARTPGGTHDDSHPDPLRQGSATRPFLERLYERMKRLGLRGR